MSKPDPLIIFTGSSPRGWHRLQQAAECMQKYAWSYGIGDGQGGVKSDEEKSSPALAKGSLMHLALAQHYARMQEEQNDRDPDLYEEPEEAVSLVSKLVGGEEHVHLVLSVLNDYRDHYHNDISMLKVFGVEKLYSHTVRGKFLFTGRIDLLWHDAGGRLWAADHKTSSRLTPSHKQYYSASGQLIGYQYLARIHHPETVGLKLNLIEVSKTPKFERITLPSAPHFEAEFEQTVEDIEERIAAFEASGRSIDKWPKAMNELTCFHRYGACEHLDRCRWGYTAKGEPKWGWNP